MLARSFLVNRFPFLLCGMQPNTEAIVLINNNCNEIFMILMNKKSKMIVTSIANLNLENTLGIEDDRNNLQPTGSGEIYGYSQQYACSESDKLLQ